MVCGRPTSAVSLVALDGMLISLVVQLRCFLCSPASKRYGMLIMVNLGNPIAWLWSPASRGCLPARWQPAAGLSSRAAPGLSASGGHDIMQVRSYFDWSFGAPHSSPWPYPLPVGFREDSAQHLYGQTRSRCFSLPAGWRPQDMDTLTRRGLARHGPQGMDTGPT